MASFTPHLGLKRRVRPRQRPADAQAGLSEVRAGLPDAGWAGAEFLK